MKKLNSSMAKRVLAVILSAAMLPAVFSGCKDGDEIDSGSTETTASSSASETTATATASAVTAAETPKSLTLLKDRERLGNGLITAVEALSEEGKCIALDSGFRITASRDASAEEIMSRVSIYPERELTIVKEAECKYLLTGGKPMPEGCLVKVAVSDEKGDVRDSWAFQTTESFRVKSVYPADGSDYVQTNSGIEIIFSSPPDVKCASEYFTVTPEIKGSFQVHRNTLYYIPSEKMKNGTVYTVTVKKGFKSDLSGELEEDFAFEFETERYSSGAYFYTYNGFSETFIKGDPMVIEVQCSKALLYKNFDLDLYRYAKAEDYKAVFENFADSKGHRRNYTADVSGLEKVFTSSEKPIPNTSDWRPSFIMLPDNLEEGYYIADISVDNMKEQYLIQVNPISVYALSLGEEHAFFINDTNTGKPASGAEVSLTLNGKTVTAKANKDGVANIDMGVNERSRGVLSVKYGDSLYIDYFDSRKADDVDYRDKYFMYLYTDRETYLTSDTVNVWGIILPRRDGVTIPKKLSLRFGESDEAGDLKEVTVAADGTFSSSFAFTDHRETWYKAIQLLDGDSVICEKRIAIDDYVKPNYTVDVHLPDYAVMPQRNPILMEITASYYEGTAAEGLTFEPTDIPVPKVAVTDENGHAEAKITVKDSYSWEPHREWIGAELTGVENAYSYFSDVVPSFFRDVMLETEYDKNTHSLTLNTTQLDFDKADEFLAANKGRYYFSDDSYDILKGKPFDTEVKVNIKHWYYVKEKDGTYYDFIEKKTVDRYSYSYKTDDIGTFTAKTVNGKAVLKNLPTTSTDGGYDFYFTYNDSFGQETIDRDYYNNKEYSYSQRTSPFKYYSLNSTKGNNNDYYYDYYWDDYDYYYYSNVYFKENEELEFELSCNKEDSVSDSGRIFLAVYQNDFISEKVYTSSKLKYSPDLSCIPNAHFEGAYFDGRHVYPVSGGVMKFDPKERNIKLEVTSDRETYDAGDTVRLSVKAVDEQGRPAANAPVMLSVVDEAAFAVFDQEVDILNDAYSHIWYPHAQNYYSYIQHVIGSENMGEKGGGGDDGSVRDYFNDNPYFGSVTTDSNGKAELVFTLADNLTTWRATLIAVKSLETGRILAGDTTFPIVAKRPLFITPVMLDTFIEGDDIAVTAKCHGIDANDEITVKITGGSIDKTLSIKSAHTANFGKLPKGDYKVLFTAEKNGNRDAIELPLTVTDTILETNIYRSFDLAEGIDITPQKWPVSLTFVDKAYWWVYTNTLYKLAIYYGNRTDMNMARGFACKELGFITEEDYIDSYKAKSGFIKILPNAEESALYTALAAAAMPELIDRTAAVPKFNYMLESKNTDKADTCIAYMGLAALGEPVLEEVKSALASGEFTDYYDCMRLTAALAMCGDFDLAYEYFVKLTPDISIYGSDPEDITALVVANGNESREQTQLALIAAAVLKLPEADYFARYLYKDRSTQYESCAMELVVYLKNYVPKIEGDAVFTYELNGKTETVQLERYYGRRIRFGEEQFKNADLKVQSGSVKVFASYIGRVSEQGNPANIKVSKTLSGDFTVGSEVTVTIRARKWCSVDDVIPSCGRYSNSRIGQRISLYTDENGMASYKFRIVSEGEYVVESAIVQDHNDGSWGKSERTTILSGKKNEKN